VGDDLLDGGDGSDVFVFRGSIGSDFIADFAVGEDVIRFENGLVADFDAVVLASAQSGSDVLISLGDGNEIRIEGMTVDALQQAALLFA
jgi:Ca2+-binding RTX toxin-like protein